MEEAEKNTEGFGGIDYELDGGLGTTVEIINAGGHKQELDRNFSLLSISAVGIVNGNTWAALGGSIVGIPPGLKACCQDWC